MSVLMILFIVSAAVMFVMIALRMVELSLGRDIIPRKVRSAADNGLKHVLRSGHAAIRKSQQKLGFESRKIPVMVLHLLANMWAAALHGTLRVVARLQGRHENK